MKSSMAFSCISSIIASQLSPSREDLVFFLITYSTESHTTAHLFFLTTNGTLDMIFTLCNSIIALASQQEYFSAREPTVFLSHTSSMEYLHVFSDEGKNNILKKLDYFYSHILMYSTLTEYS